MADHYLNPGHPRYEEVYDRVFGSDTEATEPTAEEEGGAKEFDDDWIPDFETESE